MYGPLGSTQQRNRMQNVKIAPCPAGSDPALAAPCCQPYLLISEAFSISEPLVACMLWPRRALGFPGDGSAAQSFGQDAYYYHPQRHKKPDYSVRGHMARQQGTRRERRKPASKCPGRR